MNLIGNLLFLLLGGFALSLGWALAGLLCCLTIIGIPIGLQCFKFAGLVLWPFGREIHYRQAGAVSLLANILWLVFFGLELALASAVMGLVFCDADRDSFWPAVFQVRPSGPDAVWCGHRDPVKVNQMTGKRMLDK